MIPQEILKNKNIKAVGKLIIHFLSEQTDIDKDGGIKTTVNQIADGIGEAPKNVRNNIYALKDNNILKIKGGRYPRFYLKISICPNKVKLNTPISPYKGKLKDPTYYIDNVVVVLLEKYGFDFGPVTLEKLSGFKISDQLKAIESTKLNAKSNPEVYIGKILDNNCKGIKLADKDPYEAERKRIQQFMADNEAAQNQGFKTAGYAH